MKPSFLSLKKFDLVIVPQHDRVKPSDNILLTRIAPNMIEPRHLQEQAELLDKRCAIRDGEYQQKGLTIGLLIGGDTAKYRITAEQLEKVISQLKDAARNLHCRILVTTSRRTPQILERLLKENLADFAQCKLLVIANEKNIPEAVGGILGLSDIIVVSGESISMVSEAVSAEKYVLTFIPEKKAKGFGKQERFLKSLEREKILKVIQPDNLASEIERYWKEKPQRPKLEDREAIYRAIGRLFCQ